MFNKIPEIKFEGYSINGALKKNEAGFCAFEKCSSICNDKNIAMGSLKFCDNCMQTINKMLSNCSLP
jgi:hypothetical protein